MNAENGEGAVPDAEGEHHNEAPGSASSRRTASSVARAMKRRDATDAEAKAMASSVRIRILRLCLDEPLSNRQIAEAAGLNPATSLHHVRMLADTGFLEAQEPRRGRRGAREIPYRATGKSWYINAGDVTNPMIEAFVSEFTAADYEERTMGRMAAMLTESEVVEFRERIDELFEEFRSRRARADTRQWALFVAMHPGRTPEGDATTSELRQTNDRDSPNSGEGI